MTSLHQLTAAYSQLEAMLSEPDADQAQIEKYIDECEGALKEKSTSIGYVIQNLEATAKAIKDAEDRMADRRKAIENKVKGIKNYLLRNMQNSGIKSIECPEFKISLCNSPPSVIIDDESLIPLQYLRQPEPPPPAPDKKQILADIKEGVVIPGARVEQGQYVRIR